jgi:hypothetical protein
MGGTRSSSSLYQENYWYIAALLLRRLDLETRPGAAKVARGLRGGRVRVCECACVQLVWRSCRGVKQ